MSCDLCLRLEWCSLERDQLLVLQTPRGFVGKDRRVLRSCRLKAVVGCEVVLCVLCPGNRPLILRSQLPRLFPSRIINAFVTLSQANVDFGLFPTLPASPVVIFQETVEEPSLDLYLFRIEEGKVMTSSDESKPLMLRASIIVPFDITAEVKCNASQFATDSNGTSMSSRL